MIISDKYKLLVIHIPRTGTHNLRHVIKQHDNRYHEIGGFHSPIDIENYERYKDYKKIVIVRNIYERMASFYKYDCFGELP